jgi:DNA-binding transcriptional ArsR family regulator
VPQDVPGDGSDRTSDHLKSLENATRCDLLRLVIKKKSLSPVKASSVLEKDISNLSYHMRELAKVGLIEGVHQRPVRGSVEHFYAATDAVKNPKVKAALRLRGSNGR